MQEMECLDPLDTIVPFTPFSSPSGRPWVLVKAEGRHIKWKKKYEESVLISIHLLHIPMCYLICLPNTEVLKYAGISK